WPPPTRRRSTCANGWRLPRSSRPPAHDFDPRALTRRMSTLPRAPSWQEPQWRPLRADDLAEVAALEARIHVAPWTIGNFRDALAAGYSARVGERDFRIVAYGVLMLAPGEAQILNLSVVPDARREGLGRALLRLFVEDAKHLHV